MIKRLFIFFTIFLATFFCCRSREVKELEQIKLKGINGVALYAMNDNTIKSVTKESLTTKEYNIFINKDTLALGDQFYAFLNVVKDNYTIAIYSPDSLLFESNGDFIKDYRYTPTKIGVYDFFGEMRFDDTVKVPFEYKFLVIDK